MKKYQEESIQIVETDETVKKEDIPAITLCPKVQTTGSGWNANVRHQLSNGSFLNRVCGEKGEAKTNIENLKECIDSKTYNHSEIIARSEIWFTNNRSVSQLQNLSWVSEFTHTWHGKCISLNQTINVNIDELLLFYLQNETNYALYIHDPQFFMITENHNAIPRTLATIELGDPKYITFTIQVIRNVKLWTKSKQCNDDKTYSFTSCIRNNISGITNCR